MVTEPVPGKQNNAMAPNATCPSKQVSFYLRRRNTEKILRAKKSACRVTRGASFTAREAGGRKEKKSYPGSHQMGSLGKRGGYSRLRKGSRPLS